MFGRQLPFAERGVGQGVEAAAAAVALEDAENRRRQRGQRFAFDDRAGFAAEELDVDRVAAPAAIERADDLIDAARLRRARLARLELSDPSTAGHEQRQRAADVGRNLDGNRPDLLVAAIGPE